MGALREAMQRELALRGFAAKTQQAYLGWIRRVAQHFRTSPDELSETQLRDYLARLGERGLSPSTINQAIGAIRFFRQSVLRREWDCEVVCTNVPRSGYRSF
jgi:site-specific recombinase XerD